MIPVLILMFTRLSFWDINFSEVHLSRAWNDI